MTQEFDGVVPVLEEVQSNDITVDLFLNEQILFTDIPRINEIILEEHPWIKDPTLEDIANLEEWVKEKIYNL